jgi:hypothetical protein
MHYRFEITEEQYAKVQTWLKDEVYPIVVARQRGHNQNPSDFARECWEAGVPYSGAIAQGASYEFTPNSIGMHVQARYEEFTLDLTNYEDW